VPVSEELFLVLTTARQLAELTAGQYDPTIGPLTRLWREARQTGVPTIQSRIDAAKQLVGYEKLLLDTKSRTVELTHAGMRLDLGSIAKGYAGDEALRILKKRGISIAAYEAGGDKVFGAPPPGEKGWPVKIEATLPKISPLANCAVSISGDSEQFFLHEGKRYGHIIDPKTGSSYAFHATCVVIARKGLEADPLSTIGAMMPRASYLAFLRQHFPDVVATVFAPSDSDRSDGPRIPPL
jgi:thiamine biosynthesis lipoprotein